MLEARGLRSDCYLAASQQSRPWPQSYHRSGTADANPTNSESFPPSSVESDPRDSRGFAARHTHGLRHRVGPTTTSCKQVTNSLRHRLLPPATVAPPQQLRSCFRIDLSSGIHGPQMRNMTVMRINLAIWFKPLHYAIVCANLDRSKLRLRWISFVRRSSSSPSFASTSAVAPNR
jgi:hypothetical protein